MAKRKKQITVTIDRRKWVRGSSPRFGEAALLNDRGEMCCLGFLGQACGVPLRDLKNHEMPDPGVPGHARYPELLLYSDAFRDHCADVNDRDSKQLSGPKREAQVKRLFAKMGVKTKFVGPRLSKLPVLTDQDRYRDEYEDDDWND